jgi:protein N-lysine methyltransferase METTL21A
MRNASDNYFAQLVLEEQLDEVDPLRHLRHTEESHEDAIIPPQPPSVLGKIAHTLIYGHRDTQSGNLVTVKLAMDMSPGCGGIAWPAGEVICFANLPLSSCR